MPRPPSNFRQRDVQAAIKAAKQAGIEVGRIEIDKDGKIIICAGKPIETEPDGEDPSWDKAIKRYLERSNK
jgi:hypothetical protein